MSIVIVGGHDKMSKDYIKCDCCDKKIFFGDVVYFDNNDTMTIGVIHARQIR